MNMPHTAPPHRPIHHGPIRPGLALAAGVLCLSTGAIFARLADAPAYVVAFYRTGIAALLMGVVALLRYRGEFVKISRTDMRHCMCGGLFLAVHFVAWLWALEHTSVAVAVLLVNTCPIWVALMTPFTTRDPMGRAMLVGIGLSLIGGALVVWQDLAAHPHGLKGDLLAILGAIAVSVYLISGRKARERLPLPVYATICYGTAALALLGCILISGTSLVGFTSSTWLAILGMALVSQLVGHSSANYALRWMSAGTIAVVLLGEPVLGGLMAWAFFGETLTAIALGGMALVLVGIVLTLPTRASSAKG
jgi:drug/metabolite transporter (DMT)-like permease